MKIIFLGDVMGRSGRHALRDHLPGLINEHQIDFVIANGENSAGGFGTVSYTHLTLPTMIRV